MQNVAMSMFWAVSCGTMLAFVLTGHPVWAVIILLLTTCAEFNKN
jgi:hypothetical protein